MTFFETIDIEIPLGVSGQGLTEFRKQFDNKGTCIRAALIIQGTLPVEPIDIKIKDTTGATILPSIDYTMFPKPNGNANYIDCMMPLTFNQNKIVVSTNVTTPLNSIFRAKLLFLFMTEDAVTKRNEMVDKGIVDPIFSINKETNRSTCKI